MSPRPSEDAAGPEDLPAQPERTARPGARRFGHQSLTHRPTGKDTEEQYIELIQERTDLSPWSCWQVAISEADRDRWKRMRYLSIQAAASRHAGPDDELTARQISTRRRQRRNWRIVVLPQEPEPEPDR